MNDERNDVAGAGGRELIRACARMRMAMDEPEPSFLCWWLLVYDALLVTAAAIWAPDGALFVALLALGSVALVATEILLAATRDMHLALASASGMAASATFAFLSCPLSGETAVGVTIGCLAGLLLGTSAIVVVVLVLEKGKRKCL